MAKGGLCTGYCPYCGRGEGGIHDPKEVEFSIDRARSGRVPTDLELSVALRLDERPRLKP